MRNAMNVVPSRHISVRAVIAAIGGSAAVLFATTAPALAGPAPNRVDPKDHAIQTVTTMHSAKDSTGFDISWVDQGTGRYFLADSANNAVDWFDATSNTFVKFLASGAFAGTAGTAACVSFTHTARECHGPNGVLTDDQGRVWATTGPTSTDLTSNAVVIDPTSGTFTRINTGGHARTDEESFDPVDHTVLMANPADGFLTWVSTTTLAVVGKFYYSGNADGVTPTVPDHPAAAGLEQPVYDPATGLFYQAVPGVGIDVFKPVPVNGVGQLVTTFDTPSCTTGPTGLALTRRQTLIGACTNGGVVVNLRSGRTLGVIPNVGGADEIWFNPGDRNVYFAQSRVPQLGVADANNNHYIEGLPTSSGSHSVAAYAANNEIFVPVKGGGVMVFQSAGH